VAVPELSLTEERIVSLRAAGCSNGEIAQMVDLEERTVEWHLARARRKLEKAAALHRKVSEPGGKSGGVTDRPAQEGMQPE
jgi:DNA-directed RNA polymerase specialized sigma24 family protein